MERRLEHTIKSSAVREKLIAKVAIPSWECKALFFNEKYAK